MRTTAILNLKGGVAKTVTTVNMAAILARDYKARVLLIDADCQCNCTEFFGGASDKGTLADILRLPDSYSCLLYTSHVRSLFLSILCPNWAQVL